jgi:hypothetical protein
MTALNTIKWMVFATLGLSLSACGGGGTETEATTQPDTLDTVKPQTEGGLMKVGGKLFSIPSPVQTALLIKKLGLPYQKDIPLALDQSGKMASRTQRALGMGIYGADMAYVTIHKDPQRALSTMQTIEQLSAQLDLQNAFDKALVERFKRSLSNEDSLLLFTGVAFRSADEYLKVNDRNDISALVLAGGWIESMYLTVAGVSGQPDAALMARLGEQKHAVENLIGLMEGADTEHAHTALINGLKDLLTAYAGVNSVYEYQAPTVDVATKTTYVNSKSSVKMTPEQFKAISTKVSALRSTLIA